MKLKSKVTVLYTQPETVIQDYQRLFELAGGADALSQHTPTILKVNITWHFPMPGANTTPWQLEGTILASSNQVAIDAVAAKLMGFEPLNIKYIRLAHEQGLGKGDPREIELVGDDVAKENWQFKVGYNSHSFLAWLAWYGPTRGLQKLVLRTPLVILPTLIGEIEQDYLYWPLKYRNVARQWRKDTAWGRLFQEYQEKGHLAN